MRALNRARLLWGYLRGKAKLNALPVEYIVETTAKCNLYCPMCPRETHKQPKEDMADEIFDRLVTGAGAFSRAHDADRIWASRFSIRRSSSASNTAQKHNISTLLSTNGTLLDEASAEKLLATPLEHITLSFDGSTKESSSTIARARDSRKCETTSSASPA